MTSTGAIGRKAVLIAMAALAAGLPGSTMPHAGFALAAGGQSDDWADETDWPEFETSKAICRSARAHEPPASDRPPAAEAASLEGCSSMSLYYGIGMTADPERARQCAFLEASDQWPFAGRDMLMTIYANGRGARRDLDVAIHLACGVDGAPFERDTRVMHLAALRSGDRSGGNFDYCDDITSGLAAGYCASRESQIAEARREAQIGRLTANWSASEKEAFTGLRRSFGLFAEAHVNGEIDLTGTLRSALQIGAMDGARDEFLKTLNQLSQGTLPSHDQVQLRAADADLNAAYQQRLSADFGDWPGAVTQEGIRTAERAWLSYRDAFLAFAATKFPNTSGESLATVLTRQRTEMLRAEE